MNVPDGWRTMTLDEVGTWFGGGTPSKSRPEFWDGGTVPWLSPKDMGETRLSGTRDKITDAAVSGSAVRMVPAGAVAFVVRSGILERALPSTLVSFPTTLNQDMKALVPHADIVTPEWLAHAFRAFEHPLLTGTRKAGTTVASLDFGKVKSFQLPVPPLPEQRRIVELVEEHMAHLDAADASLASAEQRARALTASSRANLVSEGQRLGVDSTVGAHSTEVAYGSSSKTSDASDGVPVLRMGNIQDGQLDWSSLKYLPRDHAEFPKLLLRDGDLLFNRTNSAELVGKSAVFRGERSASYASYLIRVRFDDTVLPEWANLCINSPQGRAHVKSVLAQQVGQANVNGTKLKAFPLPVPPVEDQRRLLESADRARQEALRTTQTTHTTRRRSAALRRAVLTAAFSGHLTSTTDPSDLLQESIA